MRASSDHSNLDPGELLAALQGYAVLRGTSLRASHQHETQQTEAETGMQWDHGNQPVDARAVAQIFANMTCGGSNQGQASASRLRSAAEVAERFIRSRTAETDEAIFNGLFEALSQLKDEQKIDEMLQLMQEIGVPCSQTTLGILVKAYGNLGNFEKVVETWDSMKDQQMEVNDITAGCMMNACVRCGQVWKAAEIFEERKQKGQHRNTFFYTTLIKGHGSAGDLQSATELFREMGSEGVEQSTYTQNVMMNACVTNGDLPLAEHLFMEMLELKPMVRPDIVSFSILMKGYCQKGDLPSAILLAKTMDEYGIQCDDKVYNTLIDASVKANEPEMALGLVASMADAGVQPSNVTRNILTRLFRRRGHGKDSADMVTSLYRVLGFESQLAYPEARLRQDLEGQAAAAVANAVRQVAERGSFCRANNLVQASRRQECLSSSSGTRDMPLDSESSSRRDIAGNSSSSSQAAPSPNNQVAVTAAASGFGAKGRYKNVVPHRQVGGQGENPWQPLPGSLQPPRSPPAPPLPLPRDRLQAALAIYGLPQEESLNLAHGQAVNVSSREEIDPGVEVRGSVAYFSL